MDTRGAVHHAGHRRRDRYSRPRIRRMSWPVACWVFVLLAIGVVQIVRVQWFDAAVFFAAGTAVGTDALRVRTAAEARAFPAVGLLWLSVVAGVAGAVMCFLPRHGTAMKIVVIAVGVVTSLMAWSGGVVAHPRQRTAFSVGVQHLALAWAAIVVAGCIWELIQFILGLVQPQAAWFSLSDLLNPTVASIPGRIAFIAGWLALGVWLLRRGGRR